MNRRVERLCVAVFAFALVVSLAWAEDEVHRRSGGIPVRGQITAETAAEIIVQKKDGKTETVPVNEVARVKFDGKTGLDMSQAEILEGGGEYQKAIEAYAKIARDSSAAAHAVRAARFGVVRSQVAEAERAGSSLDEANQALEAFAAEYPNSRFHFPLHEMLGRLRLSQGQADAARTAFAELGKAPWPEYKLKAAFYEGRILASQGQLDQAIGKFDSVIAAAGKTAEERLRAYEATLGKGECLVKQKKHVEAEKALRDVIENVASSETALHAAAFNLLGDLYRESGKPKDALLSYLQVDLLYHDAADEHAKSLCYIAILWDEIGRPDRAEAARETLKKDYSNSPWVKQSSPQSKTGGQ